MNTGQYILLAIFIVEIQCVIGVRFPDTDSASVGVGEDHVSDWKATKGGPGNVKKLALMPLCGI